MRVLLAGAVTAALLGLPAAAHAQETPRLLRTLGEGPGERITGVRGAAFRGTDLAVLTAPGPAIHLFSARGHHSWAERGRGTGQLSNPQNLVWAGRTLLVRDSDRRQVVAFDTNGRVTGSRALPAGLSTGLSMAGADTLLTLYTPTGQTVVRLRGQYQDTVLRYARVDRSVQLSEPGTPSLDISLPFLSHPLWAALSDGGVAFWDGTSTSVRLLNRAGREVARLPLPRERHAVTAADREAWLANALPQIRGQAVFEPLREQARSKVTFPRQLPPALAMMADPSGGVWVLQTTSTSGQRWVRLAVGEPPLRFRLPPGQALLSIGHDRLAVHARTGDGERVHVYAKPRSGTPRHRASR